MRKKYLKNIKKVVLKLGTNVLFAHSKNVCKLEKLICDIAFLKEQGFEIIIVSSGAIGFAVKELKMNTKPKSLEKKQALAAIGQSILMQKWSDIFKKYNILVSQILLTYDIVQSREKFINVKNCFSELKNYKAVPIINENDSVAVTELNFGDNDNLSVFTSLLIDADLLVMFTDIDGIFDKNPKKNKNAKRISILEKIDEDVFSKIEDKENNISKGGMKSKLNSAKLAAQFGMPVVISDGINPKLKEIIKGEDVGSFIVPQKKCSSQKKKWLLFNEKIKGEIFVDDGAKDAVILKHKSLLPSGITLVQGDFNKGDIVGIFDERKKIFARGITHYSKNDIEKIKGLKTKDIVSILNRKSYDEVIDRNNMIIII